MKLRRRTIKEFFEQLGPGLITGVVDDDPPDRDLFGERRELRSVRLTALFCFPLMSAVQFDVRAAGLVPGAAWPRCPQALFALGARAPACCLS